MYPLAVFLIVRYRYAITDTWTCNEVSGGAGEFPMGTHISFARPTQTKDLTSLDSTSTPKSDLFTDIEANSGQDAVDVFGSVLQDKCAV